MKFLPTEKWVVITMEIKESLPDIDPRKTVMKITISIAIHIQSGEII